MDVEELRTLKLFAGLPLEELEIIAPMCNRSTVLPGTYLVKEGDHGYHFFGILEGEVTVKHAGETVATLEPGDVFGEMALIEDHVRNANVIAEKISILVTMMSWDFRDALKACPQFRAAIDELSEARAG